MCRIFPNISLSTHTDWTSGEGEKKLKKTKKKKKGRKRRKEESRKVDYRFCEAYINPQILFKSSQILQL